MKLFALLPILLFSAGFSVFGQSQYVKTIDNTFSGGNNGMWQGNMATDVVKTVNSTDGVMNVAVNKVSASWSVLTGFQWSGCWSDRLILDQTNRYVEFRVKADTIQSKPIAFKYSWGGCDGCCFENKTWKTDSFTISEADKWTTIFFKISPTTGGSQNVVDTLLDHPLAMQLENGNYSFDYFKMGEAAIPPVPTIDITKMLHVISDDSREYSIGFAGISIPGRTIDGLTIKAEAKSGDSIFQNVHIFLDNGNPFVEIENNIASSVLKLTPAAGSGGKGDSIIITLEDTIRGTTLRASQYFRVFFAGVNDVNTDITVFPTNVTDIVTVEFPEIISGKISVIDMMGNIVISQNFNAVSWAKIDLSATAPGMYIIKISNGKDTFNKKVIKQ